MKSKCCNKRVLKSKEENICYCCGRVCEMVEEKSPQEEIRKIWEEMKELKYLNQSKLVITRDRREELSIKFEEVETLFDHESTLSKAIIYYLNQK
ncbi:MAG: hypothetical protein WC917_03960 [Bacilli bacterium]|jgi:esterase/lipase